MSLIWSFSVILVTLCAVQAKVQATTVKLSCANVKTLVDDHNTYRRQLARGEVPGQPKARDMQLMIWDDELASKAEKYAAKGVFEHNPDRTISSGRFTTGENLYTFRTTSKQVQVNVSAPTAAWFDEHRHYEFNKIGSGSGGAMVGHYTQIAWATSIYLGCGLSKKVENGWTSLIYVCNYGPPGNYVGQYPYKTGPGCEDLCCSVKVCGALYGAKC